MISHSDESNRRPESNHETSALLSPRCVCRCKMCRVPGGSHCFSRGTGCYAPAHDTSVVAVPPSEVAPVLQKLKAGSGTHSPSVAEIERALPGMVHIDACFLSNPYATSEAITRLRAMSPARLERLVSHYPSQNAAIAELLAQYVGVDPGYLFVSNGACELIAPLLGRSNRPTVISIPSFSAYYELASGPIVTNILDPHLNFALDLEQLRALAVSCHAGTIVVVTPNNPDGGLVDRQGLVDLVASTQGIVDQVIVDESFAHFSTAGTPSTLAPLVEKFPHLVVLNSMSKSHGIAGMRLGYAAMARAKVKQLRQTSLWNINAFAEWYCEQLDDPDFRAAYEAARRRYVRETDQLFDALDGLPSVRRFPSAANFALLELDRPADQVVPELLARHHVYVRDCGDKRGLSGERYIRIGARDAADNRRIVEGLAEVLSREARGRPRHDVLAGTVQ